MFIFLRGKSGKVYIGIYLNGECVFVKYNMIFILLVLVKE